jgi:hypothetical protein
VLCPLGLGPAKQVEFIGRASRPRAVCAGVVTTAETESADVFAGDAPSNALTVYEYIVLGLSPPSKCVVWFVVAICCPLRSTR